MRAEQHDDTLGPCPWCSSTKHWVYDEGSEDDRTERDFWAQCAECSQCSPSYPTIETLREGWAECRRGEQPEPRTMACSAPLERIAAEMDGRKAPACEGKLREWARQLRALERNPDLTPAEVWVGPFANSTQVWATRQAFMDEVEPNPDPEVDPRVYEPRPIPVKP